MLGIALGQVSSDDVRFCRPVVFAGSVVRVMAGRNSGFSACWCFSVFNLAQINKLRAFLVFFGKHLKK